MANWPWLVPNKVNIYFAFYTSCNSKLNFESVDVAVEWLEKWEAHLKSIKELEPFQATFSSQGQDVFMGGHSSIVAFSSEQQT